MLFNYTFFLLSRLYLLRRYNETHQVATGLCLYLKIATWLKLISFFGHIWEWKCNQSRLITNPYTKRWTIAIRFQRSISISQRRDLKCLCQIIEIFSHNFLVSMFNSWIANKTNVDETWIVRWYFLCVTMTQLMKIIGNDDKKNDVQIKSFVQNKI